MSIALARVVVDRTFAALGEDMTLSPDTTPVTVTGIRRAPGRDDDVLGVSVRSPEAVTVELRATDGANLARGDVIVVAGARRIVSAPPFYRDPLRLVLMIETEPE